MAQEAEAACTVAALDAANSLSPSLANSLCRRADFVRRDAMMALRRWRCATPEQRRRSANPSSRYRSGLCRGRSWPGLRGCGGLGRCRRRRPANGSSTPGARTPTYTETSWMSALRDEAACVGGTTEASGEASSKAAPTTCGEVSGATSRRGCCCSRPGRKQAPIPRLSANEFERLIKPHAEPVGHHHHQRRALLYKARRGERASIDGVEADIPCERRDRFLRR